MATGGNKQNCSSLLIHKTVESKHYGSLGPCVQSQGSTIHKPFHAEEAAAYL